MGILSLTCNLAHLFLTVFEFQFLSCMCDNVSRKLKTQYCLSTAVAAYPH